MSNSFGLISKHAVFFLHDGSHPVSLFDFKGQKIHCAEPFVNKI